MAKQFTKVTKTYSTKNKLQLLILKELELIDCILFTNATEAGNYVNQLYQNALRNYKGNAAVPELKCFKATENDTQYYVDDVISISVYKVKTDLS